ncbi:MAG TPA: hypothetical protein VGF84_08465, partial [Micromonosporaceae bacterium]
DEAEARVEFALAVDAFARHRNAGGGAARVPVAGIRGTTALDIHTSALGLVLGDTVDPLRVMLAGERAYWLQSAQALDLPDAHPERLDQIVAAATLFATDDYGAADRTLAGLRTLSDAQLDTRDRYLTWVQSLYPGHGALSPMRPDALADRHIAATIEANSHVLALADRVSDAQAIGAIIVMARAAAHHDGLRPHLMTMLRSDPGRLLALATGCASALEHPQALLTAMSQALDEADGAALDRIVAALPQRSVVLAAFATDATGRAWALHRQEQPEAPGTAQIGIRYAVRLAYLGTDPARALAIARDSVAVLARLLDGEPNLCGEVAEAWAVLAIAASDAGEADEALAAGDTAIDLYRRIESPSEEVRAGLGTALHNQSIRRGHTGDVEVAYRLAMEARAVIADLAETRPAAYLSLLADALDNLAAQASRGGLKDTAIAIGTAVVALWRIMAERRPDAYAGSLARSLSNHGVALRHSGRPGDASDVLDEAIERFEVLVEQFPGRYEADLVIARRNRSLIMNLAVRNTP